MGGVEGVGGFLLDYCQVMLPEGYLRRRSPLLEIFNRLAKEGGEVEPEPRLTR